LTSSQAIRFQNGDPLTAEHVAATFKELLVGQATSGPLISSASQM
jgi:hypothetical protein